MAITSANQLELLQTAEAVARGAALCSSPRFVKKSKGVTRAQEGSLGCCGLVYLFVRGTPANIAERGNEP